MTGVCPVGMKPVSTAQERGHLPGLASVTAEVRWGHVVRQSLFWLLLEYIILPQGPLVTRREFGVDEGTHKPKGK